MNLVKLAEQYGLTKTDFKDLVNEAISLEAEAINADGLSRQIDFLVAHLGTQKVKEFITNDPN